MLGLLAQPKQQSADAAIFTLCDRLTHSALLEDRRAAVLTLRGLAHENRELVASSGLRGLLDVLTKDYEDPGAAKATLETFLVLLNTETRRKVRHKRYISPLLQVSSFEHQTLSDLPEGIHSDISLWLTDELLQNEKALKTLLELIPSKSDPFTSVYALQLVSAMVANRPTQTKEALIMCGGVTPLITALGSVQDMVRDETLLLLTAITANHLDLQKLVAFEGGFDKVFDILSSCGGAVFGGRVAEDCLSLLANLIEFNASNQKLFTQSGYVAQYCKVLQGIIDAQNEGAQLRVQAISNIESSLQIGQILLIPGADQTHQNQMILKDSGALNLTLQIAFGHSTPAQVRVAALMTVASLINSNDVLQADLLSMDVPYYPLTNMYSTEQPRVIPVAQALLNWAVALNSTHLFDLRVASLECLTSSFISNAQAKYAFIHDQVEGYAQHLDDQEDVNLISVVAEYSEDTSLNPFRVWFACAIIMRLFVESSESKDQLRKVKVGDESLGMEVHSLIQAIAGELQTALLQTDPTVALGYLQLLTVWLYDDTEAVNELTAESSVIQALLAHQSPDPLVESLSVIVLGTAYTFCTKDSPVSRIDFHNLLTKTLGKDQYLVLVRKFRQSPIFQNFEASDMFGAPRLSNGNPAVYVDIPFVELMREHISYISRAIFANPKIEPSSKVTLEMLDEVKSNLHQKSELLEGTESQLKETKDRIGELESRIVEYEDDKKKTASNSQEQDAEIAKLKAEVADLKPKLTSASEELEKTQSKLKTSTKELNDLKQELSEQTKKIETLTAAKDKAEKGVNEMTREIFQLQRAKDKAEKEVTTLKSADAKLQSEIKSLKTKLETSHSSESSLKKQVQEAQKKSKSDADAHSQIKDMNEKLVAKLKETAADLKEREEEEEELKTQLSATKVKAEDTANELVSIRNREAQARKELELAKAKIESLKKDIKKSDSASSDEVSSLRTKVESLESELSKAKLTSEKSLKDATDAQKKELSEKESSLKKVNAEIEDLNKNNTKLKDLNSQLLKQVADLKNAADKAKEESKAKSDADSKAEKDSKKEAEAKEAAAKDEASKNTAEIDALKKDLSEKQETLDELMVLLDDLTEKKTAYKTRLREKEEDVSESEADDDDDDEE